MAQNQAAWLDAKNTSLRVGPADMPKAGPNEVTVKVHALAINPIDHKIQDTGFIIQSWPTIIGEDVAGEIHEVGEGVTRFKKGDRVASHAIMFIKGDPTYGGFQKYVRADAAFTALLPSSTSFVEGSVFPLAMDAAAAGLYTPTHEGGLGLAYPSTSASSADKTIVVWGGSSSVGSQAIQLAVASGLKVITVASKRNFAYCKSVGAHEVFDYNSSSVVDDVVKAIKAAGGEFAGLYDAVSLPESYKHVLPILEKAGGKQLAIVTPVAPENPPAGVKVGTVFAISPVVHPIWSDYFTKALEKGTLKSVPQAQVVGKGLESVQSALEASKKGVSAKKIVVEL